MSVACCVTMEPMERKRAYSVVLEDMVFHRDPSPFFGPCTDFARVVSAPDEFVAVMICRLHAEAEFGEDLKREQATVVDLGPEDDFYRR